MKSLSQKQKYTNNYVFVVPVNVQHELLKDFIFCIEGNKASYDAKFFYKELWFDSTEKEYRSYYEEFDLDFVFVFEKEGTAILNTKSIGAIKI